MEEAHIKKIYQEDSFMKSTKKDDKIQLKGNNVTHTYVWLKPKQKQNCYFTPSRKDVWKIRVNACEVSSLEYTQEKKIMSTKEKKKW